MNVFVDACVFINDYLRGNGGRLAVLKAFEKLHSERKFKLIFPKVTRLELQAGIPLDYIRYSENEFSKMVIPDVPSGVELGTNYKEAKEILESYSKKIEEVRKEAELAVDDLLNNHINKLIENAENIQEDRQVILAAHERKTKNKPPGKNTDPLGDEIVWELLLQHCNDDELVIVTRDNDWVNKKNKDLELHPILAKEWKKKSAKSIQIFSSLASFVESIDPNAITKEDVKAEESYVPPFPYFIQPPDFLFAKPSLASQHPAFGTSVIEPVLTMRPGLASAPSGTWQPVSFVGTPNSQVQCVSCMLTFPVQECYVTMRGYYCRNCYNLAGSR